MKTTGACEKGPESFVADTLANETGRKGGAADRRKTPQINLDNEKAEGGKRKPFSAGNCREMITSIRSFNSSDNMR
jgi:hypothetical protein